MVNEKEILEAALLGYQSQVSDLQNKMREIETRLNPDYPTVIEVQTGNRWQRVKKPQRSFSAESRAKMSAAAKKWRRLLKRDAA